MSIDLAALIQRYKPERRLAALPGLSRSKLLLFDELTVRAGMRLLLDTGIYIREAAGRLSPEQRDKLARVERHHCTVCLGEIAVGLANRDVRAATWPDERKFWEDVFAKLPKVRTYAPDAETWAAAGILAGTLTRLQGFQAYQREDALNDALIYLTALKRGVAVLTENRRDFDWLKQLVPSGHFYLI